MHVQAAETRDGQHFGREDGSIGGHARHVGAQVGKPALHLPVAQRAGSQHWDAQFGGNLLHRGGHQLPAPPAHGVGARVNRRHLVLLGHLFQNGRGERRRPHEHDAHRQRTRGWTEVSPGLAPAARACS